MEISSLLYLLTQHSINFSKTNYMIIKSSRKTFENIEIKLQSMDGSCHLFRKKRSHKISRRYDR